MAYTKKKMVRGTFRLLATVMASLAFTLTLTQCKAKKDPETEQAFQGTQRPN